MTSVAVSAASTILKPDTIFPGDKTKFLPTNGCDSCCRRGRRHEIVISYESESREKRNNMVLDVIHYLPLRSLNVRLLIDPSFLCISTDPADGIAKIVLRLEMIDRAWGRKRGSSRGSGGERHRPWRVVGRSPHCAAGKWRSQ